MDLSAARLRHRVVPRGRLDNRCVVAGKVRNGLTPRLRRDLFSRLDPLAVERCPFANLPTARTGRWGEGITVEDMPTLTWVTPTVVAEIAFTEWTAGGNLRHASFLELRDDKAAKEVRRESGR
jgi:bifunctional non-homologous end joining protein LigD